MYHIGWSSWQKKSSSKCPLFYAPVVAECPSGWVFEVGESPSAVMCFIQDLCPSHSAAVPAPRQQHMSQCPGQLEFWATALLTNMNCFTHVSIAGLMADKEPRMPKVCGNPSARVPPFVKFSNVKRAGFSNPHDETCSQSSCQEAISQHGKQNSPACHRHSRVDGLTVFYMSFVKEWSIAAWTMFVCLKQSCLLKLLLINMPLVRCCSNTNRISLRGERHQW